MINLRYHIVSITAVFLALGIGVALGGTFLDRYTFDLLERNIGSAEARIKETDAENAALKAQIARSAQQDTSLIQVGSSSLFAGQLTDVPVLIVAQGGVGADDLTNLRQSLVRAGADLRGTLELRDGLLMAESANAEVAAAVDESADDPAAVRSAVNRAMQLAFGEAGAVAPASGPTTTTTTLPGATTAPQATDPATTTPPASDPAATTTTTTVAVTGPAGEQPAILTALLAADYVRYNPATGYTKESPLLERTGYRFVFVGGTQPTREMNKAMIGLLPSGSGDGFPAVVVSPSPPTTASADTTPTITAAVIADANRASIYNTVDNVDTFSGLAATVLVLHTIDRAEPGHYGQSAGATALLPGAS